MPELDEQELDVKSSDTSALDETAESNEGQSPVADDGAAKSSAATGEEEKDLLSVVRDAVDKTRKTETSTASPATGEEAGKEDDGAAKKPDDENYSDVPFHKHPRFQHVLRRAKANEADASRYHNVQNFLDTNGLSGEEAADGLSIMALAKTNPAECWTKLRPFVEKVLIAAGEVLPDDIQSRVQQGELSQNAALELSRQRATVQSIQAAQTFREQLATRQQQTAAVQAVTDAAVSWEQDRRLKDPNFETKMQPLMKEVAYLQAIEGKPATPEGVREQLQRAYKAVNAQFAPLTPAPPAQRQKPAITPIRGGQVAGTRQTEVSTLDIVRQHTQARR